MGNRPTKQYLDYLVSTYMDTSNTGTNGKALNILEPNINHAEFQCDTLPHVTRTNQCKNDSAESDSSI